jgi:hypothetical protein
MSILRIFKILDFIQKLIDFSAAQGIFYTMLSLTQPNQSYWSTISIPMNGEKPSLWKHFVTNHQDLILHLVFVAFTIYDI